jgi:DedD protein
MGIFSFGKKDEDAPVRRGGRTGGTRNVRTERGERRSRRTERPESDALLLDPTLPEKQRARRRLVGAIALVVAAVVVLPMVLDSHPKPVTDDIAIDIPSRPAHQAAAPSDDSADTQAGVAHDAPPASDATATAAAAPAPAVKTPAAPVLAPAPAPAAKAASVAPKAAQKPAAAPAFAPAPIATADASGADGSNDTAASPSSPAGARFALQLGSFKSEAAAKAWAKKLKDAGVPAYTERGKQADGSAATLLRAGPFADRDAASAAIAKVREAGMAQ